METTLYYDRTAYCERTARVNHPEVTYEWVARIVDKPGHTQVGKAVQEPAIGSLKLKVYYDPETDTLSLWNGRPASEGGDVGEGLTADYDAEGEVVGITLDGAAKLLTPYL